MNSGTRIFGLLALPFLALLMLLTAEFYPSYFNNVTYLGGLLLFEAVVLAVWHFDNWFFLILMITFLWAGMELPLSGGSAVRWVFLAVGAVVGLIKWVGSDRRKPLGAIHLIALLCVIAAVASSVVSGLTQMSLLKSSR